MILPILAQLGVQRSTQRWDNCPAPHSGVRVPPQSRRGRTSRSEEKVCLRSPPQSLSLARASPRLLSHRLNLNKSSPSWPHPLAAASLRGGPRKAPTGPGRLGRGGLHGCREGRLHTRRARALGTGCCLYALLTTCSETHPCAAGAVCAQPLRPAQTCAHPHMQACGSCACITASGLFHVPMRGAHMQVKSHVYLAQAKLCTYNTHRACAHGTPNSPEHTGTCEQTSHKSSTLCTYCARYYLST